MGEWRAGRRRATARLSTEHTLVAGASRALRRAADRPRDHKRNAVRRLRSRRPCGQQHGLMCRWWEGASLVSSQRSVVSEGTPSGSAQFLEAKAGKTRNPLCMATGSQPEAMAVGQGRRGLGFELEECQAVSRARRMVGWHVGSDHKASIERRVKGQAPSQRRTAYSDARIERCEPAHREDPPPPAPASAMLARRPAARSTGGAPQGCRRASCGFPRRCTGKRRCSGTRGTRHTRRGSPCPWRA